MRTRPATRRRSDVGPPGSRAESVRTCQCLRPRRAVWALAISRPSVLPSVTGTTSAPGMRVLSRLDGWPVHPLSTLRRSPRKQLRMTRGRCDSLLLHRDGLAPSTPCRSPGALRFTPDSGHIAASQRDGSGTYLDGVGRRSSPGSLAKFAGSDLDQSADLLTADNLAWIGSQYLPRRTP